MTLVCGTPPSLSSGDDFERFITALFTLITVSTRSDVEVRMFDKGTGVAIGGIVIPGSGVLIVGDPGGGGNMNETEAGTVEVGPADTGENEKGGVSDSGEPATITG